MSVSVLFTSFKLKISPSDSSRVFCATEDGFREVSPQNVVIREYTIHIHRRSRSFVQKSSYMAVKSVVDYAQKSKGTFHDFKLKRDVELRVIGV